MHLPKGHGDNQSLRGTDTRPQTLGTGRPPKVSTPLFLTPCTLVNHPGSWKVLFYFQPLSRKLQPLRSLWELPRNGGVDGSRA